MRRQILILSVVLVMSGCAHESVRSKFVSSSPVIVTSLNDQSKEVSILVPANEAFELKSDFARIEEKGKMPLLVVEPGNTLGKSDTPVQVKLRPVADWKSDATDQYISSQMDGLYVDLLQIISSAKERKTEVSLKKIDSVIERFPKLASAYYVKAQVEVLTGHPSDALSNLDIALKLRPGFMEAVALQEQLRGKK
jgi:hypothetical protein